MIFMNDSYKFISQAERDLLDLTNIKGGVSVG